jgi:hypothetical protein
MIGPRDTLPRTSWAWRAFRKAEGGTVRYVTIALATATVAAVALGESSRTLDLTRSAEGIQAVEIQTGVGDVDVSADSGNVVTAHVEVRPKKAHFWSSRQRDLDSLEIETEMRGTTLLLRLHPEQRHDVEWGEDWSVRLPARLALRIKLGVGDVTVLDSAGDVRVEVGVGDVKIEGAYDSSGDIRATCGVGDVSLRTPAGRDDGEGFIAHSLRGHGPGKAEIHVSVGVGDVTIRLR